MDLLLILLIVAMLLTFIENSTVLVIAVLIYVKQRKANAAMETRINLAIANTRTYIDTIGLPRILTELQKEIKGSENSMTESVLKSLKGWWANMFSQGSKTVDKTIDEYVELPLPMKLLKAKKEDRLMLLVGHITEQIAKEQAQEEQYIPTPEEYAKAYEEANAPPPPQD